MIQSVAHDTDDSIGTNTAIKSHTIPLNNHLNMINEIVSWTEPSASCEKKHLISMYVPKTDMPLKCQLGHVQIWDNYVSIYTSHKFTEINSVSRRTATYTFHFIGICPWANMPATSHVYVPLH